MHVFIHGEFNCLKSVPYLCYTCVRIYIYIYYISSPLDSCLTTATCLSSACSFAVSQTSDLALLVGYVA